MSWKRTIFAAITFVLMCMAYELDVVLRHKKILDITNQLSLAQGVDVSAVGEIVLKNPQGRMRLQKTGNNWRIVEPVNAPADTEAVETTLINVTAAKRTNENEVKNLAEFGLANPDIELSLSPIAGKQFHNDKPTSFALLLGNESPYTGLVFAKYPDKPQVFTVGIQVKNNLLRAANDFRRSRLFDIDTSELEKYSGLTVRTRGGDSVLKNETGRWKIVQPFEGPAENSIVREHLNKLGLLRAANFLTQSSDKPTSMAAAVQALTSPTLSITLESAGRKPQTLVIAETQGQDGLVYVAQRAGEDEIMTLRPETVDELRQDAFSFRSRDLFTMKPQDVGLFTIEMGRAAPAALIRNDKQQWEMVGDPEFRIDQQAVNDRLDALLKTKIVEFVDPNPVDPASYGLDVPRRRYTVTTKDKDKARSEVLECGASEPGRAATVYARRAGDKAVFTVELSSDLNIFAGSIADKHFARTDLRAIQRGEVDVDGQTYTLKLDQGEWKILKPNQTAFATMDVRRMQSFLEALNNVQYERDLSGQSVIGAKSGPPLAVRLYGENDRELLDITVTKKVGGMVVIASGRNRSFEVSASTVDRLYALAQSLVQ
jgi:hypothetical protein